MYYTTCACMYTYMNYLGKIYNIIQHTHCAFLGTLMGK